jgi:hypothetical protein
MKAAITKADNIPTTKTEVVIPSVATGSIELEGAVVGEIDGNNVGEAVSLALGVGVMLGNGVG